jgi:hypothetical protein
MTGWERKWEHALLRIARDCSGLLMPATSELGKCGVVQVVASVLHSWGSRGRRFKSGRPDGFSNALGPTGNQVGMIMVGRPGMGSAERLGPRSARLG